MGVELMALDDLVAQADFLTIHLPKTAETAGLIGRDLLAKAKPGLRIVNAARGGILDEQALAEAIESGQVAGAALDVFASEPCTDSPLFRLPQVVVTPHLGASTAEAQASKSNTPVVSPAPTRPW
jgi:D-3-phosphoglycerate dehydrogenase